MTSRMRFWPLAMASIAALTALQLVVARRLAAAVVEIVLEDDRLGVRREPLPGAVFVPQVVGRRKGASARFASSWRWSRCGHGRRSRRRSRRRRTGCQGSRRIQGLLHPVADAVVVVFGLDEGDRDVGFVVEDVVGALGLAARDELAANDDAALGEADFLADLRIASQPARYQGGRDELGANVAFAELNVSRPSVKRSYPRGRRPEKPRAQIAAA